MNKKIVSCEKLSLKNYSKPEAEVINFDYSDIISTSGCPGGDCLLHSLCPIYGQTNGENVGYGNINQV